MNLPRLGMHQHRAAMAAAIIDGVCAGDQDRRGGYNRPGSRVIHEPKSDSGTRLVGHGKFPFRREHEHSQSPTPGRAPVGDVGILEFPFNQSRVRENLGSKGNEFMRCVFLRMWALEWQMAAVLERLFE
jgi:hypothetical protein